MKTCRNCHEQSEDQFDSCWKCGVDLPEQKGVTLRSLKKKAINDEHLKSENTGLADSRQPPKWNLPALALFLSGVSVMVLILLGHYHIVTGTRYVSGINGIEFIARDSFGYSEMYIDADVIVRMPMILAITSRPVGYKVLLREKDKPRR